MSGSFRHHRVRRYSASRPEPNGGAIVHAYYGGSFKRKRPPDLHRNGYVVESLEAALWAFHNSENFHGGALLAVNLGDDADTTGAVFGQLAGAFYGEEGIPKGWRQVIAKKDLILGLADKLFEHRSGE